MDDEVFERKLFATFERHGEFTDIQQSCLELDLFENPSEDEDLRENQTFSKLSNILDEYQEQSYLLDPFLENLVAPVVDCLRSHAKASIADHRRRGSSLRVGRLATLLYSYVKCRGYKTIIRFFPHEIADLSIALEFLLIPDGLIQDATQWALRYVVLIWLSLICMIPFDLAQFDEAERIGHTANAIESSAKTFLGKAGLEREGAALLLSRLYVRQDTGTRFYPFLVWTKERLEAKADVITTIGLLQVVCEVVKSGPADQIRLRVSELSAIAHVIEETKTLLSNTAVRKYKTKLVSRIALRLLPAVPNNGRRKGRTLAGDEIYLDNPASEADFEVPEQVEHALEQLFSALQDKDTVVRWSAAKGVARVSERLPVDFADQVLETVMGLFAIHSIAAASLYDLPAIAESTWHGACLACAEIARRGLIASERLPELIEWLSKALYFDLRKGAHSIGSNVRDAAAYVLWALARTQDTSSLKPHAENLAQRLTAVALYDREIHIRRAASAAFQEHVGRNGLFPHGIDVLGKTDFYAVSIRRNAFLTAAPQVAVHLEYRSFLLNHVLDVVLRHWDPTMRELGSQSLRLICLTDLAILGPQASAKSVHLLDSIDLADLHGGLLALSEIALAYREFGADGTTAVRMRETFEALSRIPLEVVIGSRNAVITAAACRLISITLTFPEMQPDTTSVSHWRKIVDHGLKHRVPFVQEAAAEAMASMSKLVDYLSVLIDAFENTLIRELKASFLATQQSLGTVLGGIDYSAYPNALPEALDCLSSFVKPTTPPRSTVEARRNCYSAIPKILLTTVKDLPRYMSVEVVNSLCDILLGGLDDYSTDERGDVGSWIRAACVQGLTSFTETLIHNSGSIADFAGYFPPAKFRRILAGILKQGVERLDNVRQEAGVGFMRLLALPPPAVADPSLWQIPGLSLLQELFQNDTEYVGWNDGHWLFPRAVRLLDIVEYRKPVLTGLVLSLGSKTDSTHRPLSTSLISYVKSLPLTSEGVEYNVSTLVEDLIAHAKSQITSNSVVVPVLQTFNVLLEGDALMRLAANSRGIASLEQLLTLVTRNVARLKSIPRIQESMKIVVNLLPFGPLFDKCVPCLPDFLGHQFPSIRRETAEHIYLVLQGADMGRDTDDVEEVLLETEWSSSDGEVTKAAVERVVALFSVD
ncbi:Tubulin-specific chaperone D [Hypsizygus marmoreus]|uniref:Tubulin-specific chaperone D n=1 Tax=Hypsizygus marmoreus TaxID=39966 RepID=A0A369JF34_HYPMA|nr:Tubulin-specific chaperone D [Hypsizygus marmoreus]